MRFNASALSRRHAAIEKRGYVLSSEVLCVVWDHENVGSIPKGFHFMKRMPVRRFASRNGTPHSLTGQALSQHAQQVVESTIDVKRRGEVQQRSDFCAGQVIVEA